MTRTISFPSKKDPSSEISELNSRLTNLENNETIYQIFQYTGTSQTGTVTLPTGATFFDPFEDGLPNEVVVQADVNNNPKEEIVFTGAAVVIVTAFNLTTGVYTLSSVPDVPACLLYYIKTTEKDKHYVDQSTIVEILGLNSSTSTSGLLEVTHDATLTGNGTIASPLSVVGSGSYVTGTVVLDFGSENDSAVTTILSTLVTSANIKNATFVPIETVETSLDDFYLNGVAVSLASIVDGVSFDIRGTAVNCASGLYTVNYILTI